MNHENPLLVRNKQWAIWSAKQLRFIKPTLDLTLYEVGFGYTLHVTGCDHSDFSELAKFFDKEVRPITCNISLSLEIPQHGVLIEDVDEYSSELWLNGELLIARDVNNLLSLAEPGMPVGAFDFDHERMIWVFRSFFTLIDDQRAAVQKATTKAGIIGTVDFIEVNNPVASPSPSTPTPRTQGDLSIMTNRHLPEGPSTLRDLVERDEDEWRDFLSRRATQAIEPQDLESAKDFACLYDVEHCGDSRLAELLTIYDRVDIMPGKFGSEWFSKHNIPLPDLQELVRLKRVRIILPYSAAEYPPDLLDAVAEVDRSSIVLSRALAAKTITRGQIKEPLLYSPLTSAQQAAVLSAISSFSTEEKYRELLGSYGRMLSSQHRIFMMRGALASLGFGVGAYLGEIFLKLGNQDARLELMTCGAGIEWALGLGATYIPRDYGGFDETHNSHIIASYLSRTKLYPSDPVADRMHIISDGLLAVSDVSPLHVAQNLNSLQGSRFRNLARKLMATTPDASELRDAIDQINAEVQHFESRAERLTSWKISTPILAVASAACEHGWPIWASVAAAWIYAILEQQMPSKLQNELTDVRAMLTGLATSSSLDAVIVSRCRKEIKRK